MKRDLVKVGMRVAVNGSPTGQVYLVAELAGFNAKLVYTTDGKTVSGGIVDTSVLRKPTKRQLQHAGLLK